MCWRSIQDRAERYRSCPRSQGTDELYRHTGDPGQFNPQAGADTGISSGGEGPRVREGAGILVCEAAKRGYGAGTGDEVDRGGTGKRCEPGEGAVQALVGSGIQIPMHGNVLMTIANEDKQEALQLAKRFANIGYGIYATKGTADLFEKEGLYVHRASKIEEGEKNNVVDIIRNGRVNFVINTMSSKENTRADGFLIRRVSAENNISCMTSLDTANA